MKTGIASLGAPTRASAKIEGVVVALDGGDVDVHELDRLVRGIVDGVGVAHPNRRSDGSMQNRSAAIDGELRLAVEDDEHLFGRVMEMMSDTSARHDLTPVHEIEVDVHRRGRNQQHASHVTGAFMRAAVLVFAGVGVADSGRELSLGVGGGGQKSGKNNQG